MLLYLILFLKYRFSKKCEEMLMDKNKNVCMIIHFYKMAFENLKWFV